MKPLDPRLLRWARATRIFLAASVLGGSVTAVAIIVQAYLLATIITQVFQQGASLSDIGSAVWALAGVVVVRAVLAFAMEPVAFRSSATAKSQMRMAVLEHVIALGPAGWQDGRSTLRQAGKKTPVPEPVEPVPEPVEGPEAARATLRQAQGPESGGAGTGSGELAQLTGRGIDALDAYFARYLPQLVLAAIVPVAIIVVVATEDLLAAVIIVLTLPLIPVFMILIGLYTQRQVDRQWRTLGVLSGHFLDVVAGLPTLKIFGRARAQSATLREIGDRYRRATMGVLRVSFLSALALELLATLSVAIVAVSIGLRLVNGDMALFTGLWVLILAPEAYLPLRMVGAQFHAAADGIAAADRLLDILDQPLPARREQAVPARAGGEAGLLVTITDVTVTYPGRTLPALQRFALRARPGRIVALAGDSGAGKSTVLQTLLGFTDPSSGTAVTGTGAESWDLATTPPQQWLEQFAWLPQEPTMVTGTVADNIRLGRADASDADLVAAAVAAGLADPRNASELLGQAVAEGGAGVSAGQRRRIGLARILVREAPVVLLDEPSAALDEATEATVVAGIRHLRDAGRTVIVVAHRPGLLEIADDSVVLEPVDADAVVPLTEAQVALPGLGR